MLYLDPYGMDAPFLQAIERDLKKPSSDWPGLGIAGMLPGVGSGFRNHLYAD